MARSEPANLATRRNVHQSTLARLKLDENVVAHVERRILVRDEQLTISCENTYVDSIVHNYLIVKEILRNIKWQEKMVFRHVCTTWNSVTKTLRREQVRPVDFSLKYDQLTQESIFTNYPLAVLAFNNIALPEMPDAKKCMNIIPKCCDPPCNKTHLGIDIIHKTTTAPKECMLAVKVLSVVYFPLPNSRTFVNALRAVQVSAFIGGIFLPLIPNVRFHKINLKDADLMMEEFTAAIDGIVRDQVIKGVLVFVTSKFLDNSLINKIIILDYIKTAQPDIPYALGGCMCEDTMLDSADIDHFIHNTTSDATTDNLVSMGVFTIPKNEETKFDMFSYVVEFAEWEQESINASICRFSRTVPRYEHSVCIKLGCIGRDKKLAFEQETFRRYFPKTPIVGCSGNGEVGLNHPGKPLSEPPKKVPKKFHQGARKGFPGPHLGLVYSYATVFVYMGWGRITAPAEIIE